MTGYIGQLLLGLAGLNALLGSILRWRWFSLHTTTLLILAAFSWLIYAHVINDFSLINVFLHSHTDKPLLYKIAGAWGNHEGSFLLWLTLLSLCLSIAHLSDRNPLFKTMGQVTLLAFLSFILLSSDPFTQHLTPPLQGRDLNPLLQDPLLAIHPPFLYLGYVSFAIPFLWALAGALTGKMNLLVIRQWSLWGWTLLTIGISLGAFWAYYELGWGGWWAWDPVENAALIPWLAATAQIHLLWLAQRRANYIKTALIVICITWASCLGGTILVRSGVLTSVHTFAVDPERGILLTIISSALLLSGLCILKPYWHKQEPRKTKSLLFLMMEAGCGILLVGWFTVLLGTLYPIILEAFGLAITVGAPYFQLTFVPLMLPLIALMAFLPEMDFNQRLSWSLVMSGFVLIASYWLLEIHHLLSLITMALSSWLIISTAMAMGRRGSMKAMDLGHLGLGVTLLGMTLTLNLSQDILTVLRPGQSMSILPYEIELKTVIPIEGPNYTAQQAWIDIRYNNRLLATLKPEKRYYHAQKMIHGETSFFSHGWHHIYAVLGDTYQDSLWSVRLYVKPWINLMIGGILLMIISGFLALKKRKRIQFFKKAVTATCLLLCWSYETWALEAHEQLANPLWEKIAQQLGEQLLCPTCAGQVLNDSPSPLAQDLRRQIRQDLRQGKTRDQIIEALQHRFGPQIYRQPPVQWETVALWGLPWIALMGWFYRLYRRNRQKIIG